MDKGLTTTMGIVMVCMGICFTFIFTFGFLPMLRMGTLDAEIKLLTLLMGQQKQLKQS